MAIPGSLCLLGPGQPIAFFLGLFLIAVGLIPYKKLCQLENRPTILRCLANHIEIGQGRKSRTIEQKKLRSISQEKSRLNITLDDEVLRLIHFPPQTAERLRELYF